MSSKPRLAKPETQRTIDELLTLARKAKDWLGLIETHLDHGIACLEELQLMRDATRRGGGAISWSEVLECVKLADVALGSDLALCEPCTVRLGKIRCYAPDGAVYARLNLFIDTIHKALEGQFKIPFHISVMHRLQ